MKVEIGVDKYIKKKLYLNNNFQGYASMFFEDITNNILYKHSGKNKCQLKYENVELMDILTKALPVDNYQYDNRILQNRINNLTISIAHYTLINGKIIFRKIYNKEKKIIALERIDCIKLYRWFNCIIVFYLYENTLRNKMYNYKDCVVIKRSKLLNRMQIEKMFYFLNKHEEEWFNSISSMTNLDEEKKYINYYLLNKKRRLEFYNITRRFHYPYRHGGTDILTDFHRIYLFLNFELHKAIIREDIVKKMTSILSQLLKTHDEKNDIIIEYHPSMDFLKKEIENYEKGNHDLNLMKRIYQ